MSHASSKTSLPLLMRTLITISYQSVQIEKTEVFSKYFDNFFVEKHKRLVSEGCYDEVLHGKFVQLQSM